MQLIYPLQLSAYEAYVIAYFFAFPRTRKTFPSSFLLSIFVKEQESANIDMTQLSYIQNNIFHANKDTRSR